MPLRKRIIFILVLLIFLTLPKVSFAATWYYPMDKYSQRQTVKAFGQFINNEFYKGKEELFPFNRFYGYHAGVDLEAYPDEQNEKVPVYTIYSGTVAYIGTLPGYGGVILQKLDGENLPAGRQSATALYEHVKITDLQFKVNDHISVASIPIILTYLGDAFSQETSKERKHLHFAIYEGTDLYFRGHENNLNQLKAKWENPIEYLKGKGAISPEIYLTPSPKSIPTSITKSLEKDHGIVYTNIKNLLQIFGIKI